MSPNKRVNQPVRPVTGLACARLAPVRPAGYARRWAGDTGEEIVPSARYAVQHKDSFDAKTATPLVLSLQLRFV